MRIQGKIVILQAVTIKKKNMKKIFIALLFTSYAFVGFAESMKTIWANIPDTFIPYLDANQRQEMTKFIEMGLKGDATNQLSGTCKVDTITNDYIHLTLSESSEMSIKRLPTNMQGDSVICLVRTWSAPEKDSKAELYSQHWQFIGSAIDPAINLKNQLLNRPDTMSQTNYERLLNEIDFSLISFKLSADNDLLTASMTIPSEKKSKKEAFDPIIKLTTLKWNGGKFK